MNQNYYVNKNVQLNGDHEVHIRSCIKFPLEENALYLGNFSNCREAVIKAKTYYPQSNGCYYCCKECHTT